MPMIRKVYGAQQTPSIPLQMSLPPQIKKLLDIKKPLRVVRPTFM